MKLSPRHDQNAKASIEINEAVCTSAKKHQLTYAELVAILAQCIASWTRFEIRDERKEEAK